MNEDISTNLVFIVDGEVAFNMHINITEDTPKSIRDRQEKFLAVMQSNPTIMETEEAVIEGSTWDGNSFTPPV